MNAPSLAEDPDLVLRRARRERLWRPGPDTRALDLRGPALEALLPHRAPMLLLDAITAIDIPRGAIAGSRWINPADPVLAGHFPGEPIYPGVLLVEAMGQLASCFRPIEIQGSPQRTFATGCRAVFLRPIYPGDELVVLGLRIGAYDGLYERGVGQILRGDQICAAALVEGCHVDG